MSRTTRTDFQDAYRLVLVNSWGTEYKGPYQTLSAAKGQLTSETASSYFKGTAHIEKISGPWETVEA